MIDDNLHCLRQAEVLLGGIRDEHYRGHAPCFLASIGAHFRHVTDHYLQFIQGLESGVLNYDDRSRDPHCEGHRSAMIMLLRQIQHALVAAANERDSHRVLSVISRAGPDEKEISISSTVLRELHFLHSHTVHHFAQIAAQLRFQDIVVDRDFGVAPSTLRHLRLANGSAKPRNYGCRIKL